MRGAVPTSRRAGLAWVFVLGSLLTLILVPFVLWDEPITEWTTTFFGGPTGAGRAGAAIVLLLVGDIFLPVPSSLVNLVAGVRFGFVGGTVLAWVGLTVGCLVAYQVGSRIGRPATERLVGAEAANRVAETTRARGFLALVMFRAVPVLAEASVLVAGLARMPVRRFLAATGLSNLGIAATYAWVGQQSVEAGSFLFAFAAAVGIPLVASWLHRFLPAR